MICPHCGNPVEIGDWPVCPDHQPARMSKPIVWTKLGPGWRVLKGDEAYRATGSEFEYTLRHAPPGPSG